MEHHGSWRHPRRPVHRPRGVGQRRAHSDRPGQPRATPCRMGAAQRLGCAAGHADADGDLGEQRLHGRDAVGCRPGNPDPSYHCHFADLSAKLSRVNISPGLRTCASVAAAALFLGGLLGGCGLANKVKKVTGALQANKATIDQFTTNLRSGQPAAFQATYTTTGHSPATITYAVLPPNDMAIETAGVGSTTPAAAYARYVQNRHGQFWCQRAAAVGWSCTKLHSSGASGAQQMIAFYTPAHWATFLQGF